MVGTEAIRINTRWGSLAKWIFIEIQKPLLLRKRG